MTTELLIAFISLASFLKKSSYNILLLQFPFFLTVGENQNASSRLTESHQLNALADMFMFNGSMKCY